jgi:ribosomal protein L1
MLKPKNRYGYYGCSQRKEEVKAGKIDFKVDKTGIVHAVKGKLR